MFCIIQYPIYVHGLCLQWAWDEVRKIEVFKRKMASRMTNFTYLFPEPVCSCFTIDDFWKPEVGPKCTCFNENCGLKALECHAVSCLAGRLIHGCHSTHLIQSPCFLTSGGVA